MDQQNDQPLVGPEPSRLPQRFVGTIGVCVRVMIGVAFWTVVAAVGLAIAAVALSAIWLGARIVLEALGT